MTPAGLQRMRYMLSDYVLLNLGWFTFNVVRYYSLPADWAGPIGGFLLLPSVILGQCVLPLLAIGLYAISGYYNRPYEKSRVDDVLNTAGGPNLHSPKARLPLN